MRATEIRRSLLQAAGFVLLILALTAFPRPSAAQQPNQSQEDGIVALQEGDPSERAALRDRMFSALAEAPNEAVAQFVSARIWLFWFQAPDAEAAGLMRDALARRNAGDVAGSIAMLDRLVAAAPGWAEAWNQRATMRFLAQDFEGSLADIDEVLPLEPKHFGALSGQAMILRHLGRNEEAQSVLKEAVKINPFLADRALLEPEPEERDI
ncbi:MAG: tetratricopeptide repeat protein [Propylenella sp.]